MSSRASTPATFIAMLRDTKDFLANLSGADATEKASATAQAEAIGQVLDVPLT